MNLIFLIFWGVFCWRKSRLMYGIFILVSLTILFKFRISTNKKQPFKLLCFVFANRKCKMWKCFKIFRHQQKNSATNVCLSYYLKKSLDVFAVYNHFTAEICISQLTHTDKSNKYSNNSYFLDFDTSVSHGNLFTIKVHMWRTIFSSNAPLFSRNGKFIHPEILSFGCIHGIFRKKLALIEIIHLKDYAATMFVVIEWT